MAATPRRSHSSSCFRAVYGHEGGDANGGDRGDLLCRREVPQKVGCARSSNLHLPPLPSRRRSVCTGKRATTHARDHGPMMDADCGPDGEGNDGQEVLAELAGFACGHTRNSETPADTHTHAHACTCTCTHTLVTPHSHSAEVHTYTDRHTHVSRAHFSHAHTHTHSLTHTQTHTYTHTHTHTERHTHFSHAH